MTFKFCEDWEIEAAHNAERDFSGLSHPTHGFAIIGEVRYETFFGEVFVSQFVFGRASLPEYECEETRIKKHEGLSLHERIEKPIALPKMSAELEVYKQSFH
ncbi:hypothetical protein KUW09_24855 [Mameliella alba]|nr:hypothetical protein [Antarctobacter heliothermus]MBY6147299.1 hypothetical protein [Mameliella alba]MCA0957379.1 hypothetical protein [Mameliella alba]